MALFEYRCVDCGTKAEILMHAGDDSPQCPSCGSGNMEKQFSTFAVSSKGNTVPETATGCAGGCCGGTCGM